MRIVTSYSPYTHVDINPGDMIIYEFEGDLISAEQTCHGVIVAIEFKDHPVYVELARYIFYIKWAELKDIIYEFASSLHNIHGDLRAGRMKIIQSQRNKNNDISI